MQMIIVDANGKDVATATATPPNIKLEIGQSIRFDGTPGPVSLFGAAGLIRQERSPPLYLLGDTGGKPVGVTMGPGTFPLTLLTGPNQDVTNLILTTIPARKPLTRIWSPGDTDKDGCPNLNPLCNDSWVQGWSQNITVLDSRDVTMSNFMSTRSWGAIDTEGQGVYCHENGGDVVVNDAFMDENGWSAGRPYGSKNQWRHNNYINKGKLITYNRCWMSRACSIGAKTMRTATFNKCLISLASIAVQPLYGLATYNDCIFYRGSYHFVMGTDGKFSPVGNCAMDIYTNVQLNRSYILGGPPDERLGVLTKPYSTGAIKLNNTHNKYTDVTGANLIIGPGCELHGWEPETGSGKMISGPGIMSGSFAKTSNTKVSVDLQFWIDKIKSESVSIADGVGGAWDAVRSAVPV